MNENVKPNKVFISHSCKDVAFVKPLVDLFASIGLGTENMFCSSVPGYGIPLNNNIYDYLRELFQDYNLMVIFILSENYYNSPVSLNEMGAAWVLQSDYTSILLPKFEFKEIKGAIDSTRISIKLDSEKGELKSRLTQLRRKFIDMFGLKKNDAMDIIWEEKRDKFIDTVTSTNIYWNIVRSLRTKNEHYNEFIHPLQKIIEIDPTSYDAAYMLGIIYGEMNDLQNAVKNLKMAEALASSQKEKEDVKRKLEKLKYTM